jgi:hypothetical protein
MDLLTIGEFSRRTRLSVKAPRLYDRIGLLRPAEVVAATGYRCRRRKSGRSSTHRRRRRPAAATPGDVVCDVAVPYA